MGKHVLDGLLMSYLKYFAEVLTAALRSLGDCIPQLLRKVLGTCNSYHAYTKLGCQFMLMLSGCLVPTSKCKLRLCKAQQKCEQ